jgi:hypothetical protein
LNASARIWNLARSEIRKFFAREKSHFVYAGPLSAAEALAAVRELRADATDGAGAAIVEEQAAPAMSTAFAAEQPVAAGTGGVRDGAINTLPVWPKKRKRFATMDGVSPKADTLLPPGA